MGLQENPINLLGSSFKKAYQRVILLDIYFLRLLS